MQNQTNRLDSKNVNIRMIAATVTLFIGIGVLVAKFWAYNVTGSQAIYSDALESIVNVVTAVVGLFVVYYGTKPADIDHPYGHGKVEYFSAAFEGGLITFAAIFIVYEALRSYFRGYIIEEIDFGLLISILAGVVNLLLGSFLKIAGRKTNSTALEASGVHVSSDFWTTLGAVLGLLAVRQTGLIWIDTLCAVGVGCHLGYQGFTMVRRSVSGLMDAEDLNLLNQLRKIFEKYAGDGIIQIHHVRIIRSGWFHHIDAHAVIPEFWSVEEAHRRIDKFEDHVIEDYPYSGELNFHLDPCRRTYCKVCDYEPCHVRQQPFQHRIPVRLDDLRSKNEPAEFQ